MLLVSSDQMIWRSHAVSDSNRSNEGLKIKPLALVVLSLYQGLYSVRRHDFHGNLRVNIRRKVYLTSKGGLEEEGSS